MATPDRDPLYGNDTNRTVYTREGNGTAWFIGIIVVLALLAIGYLVFSANSGSAPSSSVDTGTPAVTAPAPDATAPAPDTSTTPSTTVPDTNAAPMTPAPSTEAPAEEAAPMTPPADSGADTMAPATPEEPAVPAQ